VAWERLAKLRFRLQQNTPCRGFTGHRALRVPFIDHSMLPLMSGRINEALSRSAK